MAVYPYMAVMVVLALLMLLLELLELLPQVAVAVQKAVIQVLVRLVVFDLLIGNLYDNSCMD
jgi:hypothetical protein